MLLALIAFCTGFAIEVACVYWVHFSERGQAWATARCSVVIGFSQHVGIGDAHGTLCAFTYAAGMGAGTYIGVRLKESKRGKKVTYARHQKRRIIRRPSARSLRCPEHHSPMAEERSTENS